MRVFQRTILIFVCTFSMIGMSQEGLAQNRHRGDLLKNKNRKKFMWVAGRSPATVADPAGTADQYGMIAKVLRIESPSDNVIANAKMWLYKTVDDANNPKKYTGRSAKIELTMTVDPRWPDVIQNGEDRSSRERESVVLEGTLTENNIDYPVMVFITVSTSRGIGHSPRRAKNLMLRYTIGTKTNPYPTKKKKPYHGCTDPPTEDILEEEAVDAESDPEEDPEPEYVP